MVYVRVMGMCKHYNQLEIRYLSNFTMRRSPLLAINRIIIFITKLNFRYNAIQLSFITLWSLYRY